ncbi:MAG TPA: hypothetical protein VI299_26990, partial [Polyangiales bacterium]
GSSTQDDTREDAPRERESSHHHHHRTRPRSDAVAGSPSTGDWDSRESPVYAPPVPAPVAAPPPPAPSAPPPPPAPSAARGRAGSNLSFEDF